jgi:hypothetical protein
MSHSSIHPAATLSSKFLLSNLWHYRRVVFLFSFCPLCASPHRVSGILLSFLKGDEAQCETTLQALIAVVAPPGVSLFQPIQATKNRAMGSRSPRQGSAKTNRAGSARSRNASAKGEAHAEAKARARLCVSAAEAVTACVPPLPLEWSVLTTQPLPWPEEDGAPLSAVLNLHCRENLPLQVRVLAVRVAPIRLSQIFSIPSFWMSLWARLLMRVGCEADFEWRSRLNPTLLT